MSEHNHSHEHIDHEHIEHGDHNHSDHVHNNHDHGDHNHDGHGHGHAHHHDPKQRQAIVHRIARATGHLNAVKKMVEDDRDCSDVLIQLAAVQSALNSVSRLILKDHIEHCIVDAVEENDSEAIDRLNEAIDRLLK